MEFIKFEIEKINLSTFILNKNDFNTMFKSYYSRTYFVVLS